MNSDLNFRKQVKDELNKISDKNWLMIIVSVEIKSDTSLSYNGEYIDNLGDTKKLFNEIRNENKLDSFVILDIFRKHSQLMKDKQKWNKLTLEYFKEDDDLSIKYEWNEETFVEEEIVEPIEEEIPIYKNNKELKDYINKSLMNVEKDEYTNDIWNKIYLWLENNASQIKKSLNPPLSNTLLLNLEKIINCNLPNDFINLYFRHNGINQSDISNLFFGLNFLPMENLLNDFKLHMSLNDDLVYADKEINKNYFYSKTRIPFCSDSSHCYLCLDMDPSEKGTVGQIILLDNEYNVALFIASSVTEMLEVFKENLYENKYIFDEDVGADDIEFLEPLQEIDIINWHHIPKWKGI